MPVVWRDALSTGNRVIDHDHKYLLCLFNAIELSLQSRDTLRSLPVFFDQLREYTREHFEREEQLQLKVQYPEYVDHKIAHQQIIDSLDSVSDHLNELLAGEDSNDALLERLNREVLGLAREWVVEHLVQMDRKLAPYLKRLPPDFT